MDLRLWLVRGLNVLNTELTESLLAEAQADLRAAFDLFDVEGRGLLGAAALRRALQGLGHRIGVIESRQLVAAVDGNGDGLVTFDEFIMLVEPRPVGLDNEADIREAFSIMDTDGDGHISRRELLAALRRHEADEATAEADAILAVADTDGDGRLGFDEFRKLMATAD